MYIYLDAEFRNALLDFDRAIYEYDHGQADEFMSLLASTMVEALFVDCISELRETIHQQMCDIFVDSQWLIDNYSKSIEYLLVAFKDRYQPEYVFRLDDMNANRDRRGMFDARFEWNYRRITL